MTENRLPLAELLVKAGDGHILRSVAEAVVQPRIDTDVDWSAATIPSPAAWRCTWL